ncbi:hypothetical protein NE644_23225, partial [Blautia wexlerae]|uniref:hypothetical protein n=1 Tax=Blautia wexlerae TaxID=418240 RepID=UPI00210BFD97
LTVLCLHRDPGHVIVKKRFCPRIISDHAVTLYDAGPSRDRHAMVPAASELFQPFLMTACVDSILLFEELT